MSKAMQLKARVKNLALINHVPAQVLLQNFMLERLLERISISKYTNYFVLKGGLLIASLVGIHNRTTMDLDATLIDFPLSEEKVKAAIKEICAIPLDDDITLILEHIAPIRDEDEYGGYRATILALFDAIKTPLKVDITTGDIITPNAVRYAFPSIFENKTIGVWAYNLETILAEKVETILTRSVFNTRPRDYYDVYILMKTQQQAVNKNIFIAALNATSEKRISSVALENKENILRTIQSDITMRQRWERYCKENYYAADIEFDDVIDVLIEIVSNI